MEKCEVKVLVAQLCRFFVTPWTVALQAPLSMRFSRQEYWSGLQFIVHSYPKQNTVLSHAYMGH